MDKFIILLFFILQSCNIQYFVIISSEHKLAYKEKKIKISKNKISVQTWNKDVGESILNKEFAYHLDTLYWIDDTFPKIWLINIFSDTLPTTYKSYYDNELFCNDFYKCKKIKFKNIFLYLTCYEKMIGSISFGYSAFIQNKKGIILAEWAIDEVGSYSAAKYHIQTSHNIWKNVFSSKVPILFYKKSQFYSSFFEYHLKKTNLLLDCFKKN